MTKFVMYYFVMLIYVNHEKCFKECTCFKRFDDARGCFSTQRRSGFSK